MYFKYGSTLELVPICRQLSEILVIQMQRLQISNSAGTIFLHYDQAVAGLVVIFLRIIISCLDFNFFAVVRNELTNQWNREREYKKDELLSLYFIYQLQIRGSCT